MYFAISDRKGTMKMRRWKKSRSRVEDCSIWWRFFVGPLQQTSRRDRALSSLSPSTYISSLAQFLEDASISSAFCSFIAAPTLLRSIISMHALSKKSDSLTS
jgi:hypothetical protein